MIRINWRNTAENLVISMITFLAGATICYVIMSKTVDSTANRILEANNALLMEAIKKETTSISNDFKTEIKKLKNRKGSMILDIEPTLDNQIHQKDSLEGTKNSFFKRLFQSKKDKK